MNFLRRLWQIFRTHKKKSILGFAVIVLAILLSRCSGEKAPEFLTAVVEKGDLEQVVEAVGNVVSERELELRFAGAGIVSQVFVKEGDRVAAGQRLAQLRAGSLGASVAAQKAMVDSALADLATLEQGSRPEDIAIAQADLESKRASLQVAQESLSSSDKNLAEAQAQLVVVMQEANVNLSGQVSTSMSTLAEELGSMESSLAVIDDVLSRTDVSDAMTKDVPAGATEIQMKKRAAVDAVASARTKALSAAEYQAAIDALNVGRAAASQATGAIDKLFSVISNLRETAYFTASARETVKSTISTERSAILNSSQSITSALSAFQNASATYDTKIAASQASVVSYQGARDRAKRDILTYETAVKSSQAQLDLKKAGARQTDIDAARARVRQQQATLARYAAEFSDTILTAPIAGTVTHVNIRIGESLPAGAAVTLLGDSPYRIEMFVSEIDIPKVQLTQSGSIELDAFRNKPVALRVGDVDTAATDKDGVPKYRVRLDFHVPQKNVKVGMTGDADIVTDTRKNVLHVPLRAVLEKDDGTEYVRVQRDDKLVEERVVTTGMESEGGEVEIVSGLNEGEVVIVLEKK